MRCRQVCLLWNAIGKGRMGGEIVNGQARDQCGSGCFRLRVRQPSSVLVSRVSRANAACDSRSARNDVFAG